MAYGSIQAFSPLDPTSPFYPSVTEGTQYSNLTTSQLASVSSLTPITINATPTLIEGPVRRTTGMIIIVPIDQPQVTFGNNPISNPIAAIAGQSPSVAAQTQTFNSQGSGWALPPGDSALLSPYYDPMYAIVPSGTAVVYFVDV